MIFPDVHTHTDIVTLFCGQQMWVLQALKVAKILQGQTSITQLFEDLTALSTSECVPYSRKFHLDAFLDCLY